MLIEWKFSLLNNYCVQSDKRRTLRTGSILSMQVNSQGSRVSRCTPLSGDVVACGVVLAQALLLTAVSVAGALAEVLAAPAAVSGRTEAGSGDRVTQRPVLTLTAAAAVRTPVIPVTGCTNTQSWGSLHTHSTSCTEDSHERQCFTAVLPWLRVTFLHF